MKDCRDISARKPATKLTTATTTFSSCSSSRTLEETQPGIMKMCKEII